MTFAQLKRKSKTSLEALKEEVAKTNKKQNFDDDRYWTLKRNPKTDTGSAIIRFLPQSPIDLDRKLVKPWIEYSEYNFKLNDKWYIEKSLKSIGKDDPVWDYNGELWQSGLESDKEQAKKQGQKKKFVANILIIKDPINPENDGTVKLFKFGPAIYQMICDKLIEPTEASEFDDLGDDDLKSDGPFKSIDVTDIYNGCEFKIRINKKPDGFYTYAKSTWSEQKPLADTDAEIEEIWKQEHCLTDLISEDKFKPYSELKARLDLIRGLTPKRSTAPTAAPRHIPTADAPESESEDLSEEVITQFFEMADSADDPSDDLPY